MTLQSSGTISLSQIQGEFGGSNPISVSEFYAGGANVPAGTTGTNGVIPTSGALRLSQFYGSDKPISTFSIVPGRTSGFTVYGLKYQNGFIYIFGSTTVYGTYATNGFVIKYNTDGSMVWGRAISSTNASYPTINITGLTDVGGLLILDVFQVSRSRHYTFSMTTEGVLTNVSTVAHNCAYKNASSQYVLLGYSGYMGGWGMYETATWAANVNGPLGTASSSISRLSLSALKTTYNANLAPTQTVTLSQCVSNGPYLVYSSTYRAYSSTSPVSLGFISVYNSDTSTAFTRGIGNTPISGTSNIQWMQSAAVSSTGSTAVTVISQETGNTKLWFVIFDSSGTAVSKQLIYSGTYALSLTGAATFFDETSSSIITILDLGDTYPVLLQYSYTGTLLGAYSTSPFSLGISAFRMGHVGSGYLFVPSAPTWNSFALNTLSLLPTYSITPTASTITVSTIGAGTTSANSYTSDAIGMTTSVITP